MPKELSPETLDFFRKLYRLPSTATEKDIHAVTLSHMGRAANKMAEEGVDCSLENMRRVRRKLAGLLGFPKNLTDAEIEGELKKNYELAKAESENETR